MPVLTNISKTLKSITMLRIKSINFTPQVLICYAFLAALILMSAFKSPATVAVPYKNTGIYTTQELPYKNAYTIHIVHDQFNKQTGYDALLMDGSRVVTVIRLDSSCHLTQAIEADNQ